MCPFSYIKPEKGQAYMKRIETQLYTTVPWSNRLQYAGQRKAVVVFSELYRQQEKKEILPDGTF